MYNNGYFLLSTDIRLTKMRSLLGKNYFFSHFETTHIFQTDSKQMGFWPQFFRKSDRIFVNVISVDKIKYALLYAMMHESMTPFYMEKINFIKLFKGMREKQGAF